VKSKIATRNYAPNDNQEIKDFHPIDAESSHCPAPQLALVSLPQRSVPCCCQKRRRTDRPRS